MWDVLNILRDCEYLNENFENDHYDANKEEIQQSRYEYMYFRNLADHIEIMLKSNKYSIEEMKEKSIEYFNKMYAEFEKSSAKSIKEKKKATMLKEQAFYSVYNVLEDALSQI